eukprot:TRINITY_DN2385_c0_g3_i5.p1 TRINITY_DN2385_c0_g3~~TRINITY_DN2385_c0_g3_i5.p1  ORF type:complete len:364 (+),score=44.40 TRINITY_DN2385_c0_g3_i5:58-1149(+)
MNSQFIALNDTNSTQRRVNKKTLGLMILAVAAVAAIAYVSTPNTTQESVKLISGENGIDHVVAEAFRTWTAKYEKVYGSSDESGYRLAVFRQNFFRIKEFYEQGPKSYDLALNEFADLTNEEFRAKYLTLHVKQQEKNVKLLPTDNLPESVNWVDRGIVNRAKDQSYCGSCWAFSTIAAVEGLHAQQTKQLTKFSEQQLIDCTRDLGNYGCGGGYMTISFDYISKNGIELESNYVYRAENKKCRHSQEKSAWKVSGYVTIQEGDHQQLKAAVAQQVVSVGIEVAHDFQFYHSGIYKCGPDCGGKINHAVAVVGYGKDHGIDYWIIRNSWGPQWGEHGYMKMTMQPNLPKGSCQITYLASYPTV